jgi:hypothetical protein
LERTAKRSGRRIPSGKDTKETTMAWLASNWIWVLLIVGFFVFHLFGHAHGGHGHAHQTAQKTGPDDAGDAHAGHASPGTGEQASDQPHRRHGGC